MNLKGMLKVSTSLMVVCAGFMSSFAQAEDYVTKSQVNAANGVAGLNASKQVTANINTNFITIDKAASLNANNRLRFVTYGTTNADGTHNDNHWIDMFYNRKGTPVTDENGKLLDDDTFYFTNNKTASRFKFRGSVDADTIAGSSVNIGKEALSPYNSNPNSPLVFLSNTSPADSGIKPNTLMLGGTTRNSVVGIKATCQNTGGGDLGGVCYQFTNMAGQEAVHRSGAGLTDGLNMELRTNDNSPLDVIGGNTLIKNEDGTYGVKGNDYPVAVAIAAGANTFKVKGTFGCGIGDAQSRCEMTGIDVLDDNNKPAATVKVTPGNYDAVNDTTIVKLPANYKTQDNLTPSNSANIKFFSADGSAYAVGFDRFTDKEGYVHQVAIVSPTLSSSEKNLIGYRMAIWTNISDGMASTEGGTNEDNSNVDMPNYYYGYNEWVVNDTSKNISRIAIQTTYYPGTADTKFGWRTAKNDNSGNSKNPKFTLLSEGENGDINGSIISKFDNGNSNVVNKYDYQLNYTYPGKTTVKQNSNYHRYSQPTLFLGLNQTNINLYADQVYAHSSDSITRTFGNEFDFVMPTKGKGAVNSRGLTLAWSDNGGADTNYATGSYMMRLHGGGQMPMGLWVSGVWPYGGKTISTDAGFFVFNNGYNTSSNLLQNVDSVIVASALGQSFNDNTAYQLFNYVSNDGNVDKAQNNSLHLGLTKSNVTLMNNKSPTCNDNGKCSVLGQVIFDPLGYVGGIALGSGQGAKTHLGLIVDADSNVIVNDKLTVGGKSVNSAIEKAENAISQSQINAANGVAGLNDSKEITANIRNTNVNATSVNAGALRGNMLNINAPSADTAIYPVRFNTSGEYGIDFFYNFTARTDGWGNSLEANTFYFSNHHNGYDSKSGNFNQYKFDGDVTAAQKVSAISFKGKLSTPSSSTASCAAGEFKDDMNYHYVCVDNNKWKRVALSDF